MSGGSDSARLDIESFSENRGLVIANQVAAYSIPLILLFLLYLKLGLRKHSAGNVHNATLGLLALGIALSGLFIISSRVKVVSIRSYQEFVISNMWKSTRVKWSNLKAIGVGTSSALYKIGPRVRTVIFTYESEDGNATKTVALLASYSGGRPTRLLNEITSVAAQLSIPCDLSKMIR